MMGKFLQGGTSRSASAAAGRPGSVQVTKRQARASRVREAYSGPWRQARDRITELTTPGRWAEVWGEGKGGGKMKGAKEFGTSNTPLYLREAGLWGFLHFRVASLLDFPGIVKGGSL